MTQSSQNVPSSIQHLAVIMDGNGRWAKDRGLPRLEGHKAGVQAVRAVVEGCMRNQIPYLTLFSFSTENWNRSPEEVSSLMELFRWYFDSETGEMMKNNIKLQAIGDLSRLPELVRVSLERSLEATKNNTALTLVLAMSYGGREELVHAARALARKVAAGELLPDEISHQHINANLWTAGMPEPDLLIRTSGELRISNFLLWQLAYSEIVVTPELWPDFTLESLQRCLDQYNCRERRFGKTSEQIRSELTQSA